MALIPALACVLSGTVNASAAEINVSKEELPVIEVKATDSQPLETIKQAVLDQYFDDYDPENAVISVSPFSQESAGLNSAVVNISFNNGGSGVGAALSVPVLIRNILTDTPEILLKEESVSIKKTSEFDPLDYIAEITDSSGILPVISVESDVNTEENGTYHVTYTVTNMLGRSDTASLEVEVYTPVMTPGTRVELSTLMINDDGSVMAMFEAINAVRAAYGLYPYVLGSDLGMTAAAIRAQECTYFLSHTRPDGTPYHTVMDQVGEPHGTVVWEILVAYGNSVESNLNWWLNEPGHAACVLGTFGSTIVIGHSGNVWEAMVY